MNKPVVGQTVWSLNIGDAARQTEQKLTPLVVVKVGSKYFTAEEETSNRFKRSTQFHLSAWTEKSDYFPRHQAYESAQAWEDQKEATAIANRLRETFAYGNNRNLTLETLRKIVELIEGK